MANVGKAAADLAKNAIEKAKNIAGKAFGFITGLRDKAKNFVKGAAQGAIDKVKKITGRIGNVFKNVKGKVFGFFKKIGSAPIDILKKLNKFRKKLIASAILAFGKMRMFVLTFAKKISKLKNKYLKGGLVGGIKKLLFNKVPKLLQSGKGVLSKVFGGATKVLGGATKTIGGIIESSPLVKAAAFVKDKVSNAIEKTPIMGSVLGGFKKKFSWIKEKVSSISSAIQPEENTKKINEVAIKSVGDVSVEQFNPATLTNKIEVSDDENSEDDDIIDVDASVNRDIMDLSKLTTILESLLDETDIVPVPMDSGEEDHEPTLATQAADHWQSEENDLSVLQTL